MLETVKQSRTCHHKCEQNSFSCRCFAQQCARRNKWLAFHVFEPSGNERFQHFHLESSGLVGEFICFLCGPFDKEQVKKVGTACSIRPEHIREALEQLRRFNPFHKNIETPDVEKMKPPQIMFHKSFEETEGGQQNISNEINVTVLFPDGDNIQETNGGFKNQEEFKKFLLANGQERVNHTFFFFCKPSDKRVKDYQGYEITNCFPLHFQYGLSGFRNKNVFGSYLITAMSFHQQKAE